MRKHFIAKSKSIIQDSNSTRELKRRLLDDLMQDAKMAYDNKISMSGRTIVGDIIFHKHNKGRRQFSNLEKHVLREEKRQVLAEIRQMRSLVGHTSSGSQNVYNQSAYSAIDARQYNSDAEPGDAASVASGSSGRGVGKGKLWTAAKRVFLLVLFVLAVSFLFSPNPNP